MVNLFYYKKYVICTDNPDIKPSITLKEESFYVAECLVEGNEPDTTGFNYRFKIDKFNKVIKVF